MELINNDKIDPLDNFINEIKIKAPRLNQDPLRYCLKKYLSNLHGLILEFGVSYGYTLDLISEFTNENVYGFDTFSGIEKIGNWKNVQTSINDKGIPETVEQLDKTEYKKTGIIKKFNKNVKFVKGYFDETLPDFLLNMNKKISFIHIDCSFYQSTKDVLENCYNYLDTETILVFNTFINISFYKEGELLAFYEFINKYNIKYEFIGIYSNIITDKDKLITITNSMNDFTLNKSEINLRYKYNYSIAIRIFKE